MGEFLLADEHAPGVPKQGSKQIPTPHTHTHTRALATTLFLSSTFTRKKMLFPLPQLSWILF